MELKHRLRALRKERKMTQVKLGKMLNYGYTAIANYESGRNCPSIKDLMKIADIFRVSVDYLIGYSERRYPDVENSFANELKEKQIEMKLEDIYIVNFLYESTLRSIRNEDMLEMKYFLQHMKTLETECFAAMTKRLFEIAQDKRLQMVFRKEVYRKLQKRNMGELK